MPFSIVVHIIDCKNTIVIIMICTWIDFYILYIVLQLKILKLLTPLLLTNLGGHGILAGGHLYEDNRTVRSPLEQRHAKCGRTQLNNRSF